MTALLSAPFFVILALAFVVRWALPRWARTPGWLILSYAFYWLQGPWLPVVLAASTIATILSCARLSHCASDRLRRFWLVLGIAVALGPFAAAKLWAESGLWATVGLSFLSFNAITCLTAAYFDDEPKAGAWEIALHLAFFPKLLQGPLAGPEETLGQLFSSENADSAKLSEGFRRLLWGAFQKAVIADRLAAFGEPLWSSGSSFSGGPMLLALYLFAAQIYFDLKGYSDIAIGSALLLDVRLPENFDRPFLARSVAEFWKRWHQTFSRWLLKQVFEPLQMAWRDAGKLGSASALLLSFTLVGLWHGFNGRFLVFGALHGILVASSIFVEAPFKALYKRVGLWQKPALAWIQVGVTFHCILLTLILFRSRDLIQSADILRALGDALVHPFEQGRALKEWLVRERAIAELLLLSSLLAMGGVIGAFSQSRPWGAWPRALRWGAYWALALGLFFLGRLSSPKAFIYAQF